MSLKPFAVLQSKAAQLLRDNVDTDQIIPSREMKSVSKLGLSDGLFAGQRYLTPGGRDKNPDFVLNQAAYQDAKILLSGKNFGCGSSREHAVWALHEYGFRAIIAESFGEIFYNNCIRNGILPIVLKAEEIKTLPLEITIDLPAQTVNGFRFKIPAGDKRMLVEGLDAIALTETHAAEIDAFFTRDEQERPWAY
jgi:3-isopropylmalate/(R)-2-methylmalate dehydratase small subunit